jgi:hypothetical protein
VLAPGPGRARALEAALEWTAAASLERAAVVLRWSGAPWAIGRDLGYAPLTGPARVERGTPLFVAAGAAAVSGGPGLAAADLAPVRGGVEVRLVLDDAAARPFATYDACLARLPEGTGQGVSWGALERRHRITGAPRRPGDADRLVATLYPLADAAPLLPVVLERWPGGARAAVVFTDHADRTDPDALRAVLWGDSDLRAEGGPGAGFLGRGLHVTRSFFVRGARRGGLDDPDTRNLADELAAEGSEVALHSISPDRDGRDAVRAGLALSARWRPVTWIDHEPYTNCEAIASEGWRAGGPYGIRDLLDDARFRWIWAAGDYGNGATRVVDLLGGPAAEARAAIYPFPLDPRLWVFRSSMFYATPGALAAALSDDALDALEAGRGLFVAHTYLGPSARTTRAPDHLARLLVHERGPGRLAIDPALDEALARLARRVKAARVASLTWTEAGDRLRALGDVEIVYLPDGGAEIQNHGEADLAGLTLAVPSTDVALELSGALVEGQQVEPGWTRLWFDLPAGGRAILRATDRLAPVPLLSYR